MSDPASRFQVPAVFRVLAGLLQEGEPDRDRLERALADYQAALGPDAQDVGVQFGPMVLHRLGAAGLERLAPPALLEQLRTLARMAAARALGRDLALNRIATALANAGCRAILLKGAGLDRYLYAREDFRMGVDADLLLARADFDRAADLLAGIARPQEAFACRPAHRQATAQQSFVLEGVEQLTLDLHWQFAQAGIFSVDYDAVFGRAILHPALPDPLRLLAPEDNLLHFALSGFKDRRLVHRQTVDAWLLLHREAIDWPLALQRAGRWGLRLPLAYLVEGLREVFGYQPPPAAADALRLRGARRRLARRLLGGPVRPDARTGPRYRLRQLGITWGLSGNLSGYLRYQRRYLANRLKDGCQNLFAR